MTAPQVRRSGAVHRETGGDIAVPLAVTTPDGTDHLVTMHLTVAEAELMHAQLSRALSPPAHLPPSPWLTEQVGQS